MKQYGGYWLPLVLTATGVVVESANSFAARSHSSSSVMGSPHRPWPSKTYLPATATRPGISGGSGGCGGSGLSGGGCGGSGGGAGGTGDEGGRVGGVGGADRQRQRRVDEQSAKLSAFVLNSRLPLFSVQAGGYDADEYETAVTSERLRETAAFSHAAAVVT